MKAAPSGSLWDTFEHTPSSAQRVFSRYLTATLVDLVVLGLFVEYWEHVVADSFTVILLAAVLFQVLLKLTIVLEHRVAAFFNARPGGFNKFMRFFTAWLILIQRLVTLRYYRSHYLETTSFRACSTQSAPPWVTPKLRRSSALS